MSDGIDSGLTQQASGSFSMQDVMNLKRQMSLAQSLLGNKGQQSSAIPMQQPAPTTTATSLNPPTSMNSPYGGAANAAGQLSNAVQQRNSQMGQMLQGMPGSGGGGGGLMNSLDLAVGGPGMGGGGPGLVSDLWNGAGSALSSLGSLFGGGAGTGAAAAAGGAAAGVGGAAALDAAAGGLGAASGGEALASILPYLAILLA